MAKGEPARKILLVETWGQGGYRSYNEEGERLEDKTYRDDGGADDVGHGASGFTIGVTIDYRHHGGRAVNAAFMAGNVETVVRPDRLPGFNDFTDDHPFGARNFAYLP